MGCKNGGCYAKATGELHAAIFHLREARDAINQTVDPSECLKNFYIGAVMTQIEILQDTIHQAEKEETRCRPK